MSGLPAVGRFDNMTVMSISPAVVQETHYDSWGLELTGLGYQYQGFKANRYLYNGKELLDDQNLNLYDFGARYFDPVIGRWISPDPMVHLREWVSPYNFVQNNPLNRIDPDGRFDWVINKNNEIYWDQNATSQATTKTGETYLGKSGIGIEEQTGNTLVYNSDGSISQGMMTLGEVTVSTMQSDHERTMSNPVVKHMQASNARLASEIAPFARHMVRSSIDAAGYTGTGILTVGTVVTPFVPHLGVGLLAVGGAVSTASGVASFSMNLLEGNNFAAGADLVMLGVGRYGSIGIKSLKNNYGVINTTDQVVVQSIFDTSVNIVDAFRPKKRNNKNEGNNRLDNICLGFVFIH